MKIEVIVQEILSALNAANGAKFKVSAQQRTTLAEAVTKIQAAGVVFDDDTILNLVDGDFDENQETYGTVAGYAELSETLNNIFEP
jgi:tRNA U34 5-carboxymethylaminomethyl modifying GTPase MnmE/TrmE